LIISVNKRPLLGGTFSHPASKFRFLDWAFLRNHPYFLPCFMAGMFGILAVIFGFFCLEEVGHMYDFFIEYVPTFCTDATEQTIRTAGKFSVFKSSCKPRLFDFVWHNGAFRALT